MYLIEWLFQLIAYFHFDKAKNAIKIANATRVISRLFKKDYFNENNWEDNINGGTKLRIQTVTLDNFNVLFKSLCAEVMSHLFSLFLTVYRITHIRSTNTLINFLIPFSSYTIQNSRNTMKSEKRLMRRN